MAKEFQAANTRQAFGRVDANAMIAEMLEHLLQVLFVFLVGRAGNEDVINIVKVEMQSVKYLIHEALESLTTVAQAKWHADKLKQAERGGNGCFGDVRRFYGYLMVSSYKVEF